MNWNRLITDLIFFVFLHLDRLSCCCTWTHVPKERVSVYDPTRKILKTILKNGELVEPYEDDVETRSIWTTDDIALTVINEQEAEYEQKIEVDQID